MPDAYCRPNQHRVYFSLNPPLTCAIGTIYRKNERLTRPQRYFAYLIAKSADVSVSPWGVDFNELTMELVKFEEEDGWTRRRIRIHTIAEEKNLTRAADRLFLTQSALSQQLSKLEAEGLPPLFTRHKGMQLTDAGKIYINGARSILKIKGDAQEALKDLSQAKIHHIHIGVCRLFQPLYYERIVRLAETFLPG
ncbi:MAG: LysR family transcriptional regulator [Enterocloster clostridioformis]